MEYHPRSLELSRSLEVGGHLAYEFSDSYNEMHSGIIAVLPLPR